MSYQVNKNGIRILSAKKTLPVKRAKPLSERVFNKTGGKCFYCGRKLQRQFYARKNYLDIDHVIPKSKGGSNDLENLLPACKGCNRLKADMLFHGFMWLIKNGYGAVECQKNQSA